MSHDSFLDRMVDRQNTISSLSSENSSPPPPTVHLRNSLALEDPAESTLRAGQKPPINPLHAEQGDPEVFSPVNPISVNRFLTQASFYSRLSQYSGTEDQVDEIGQLPSHEVVKASALTGMDLPLNMLSKAADLRPAPVTEEDCGSEMSSSYSIQNLSLPTVTKHRSELERQAARQPPDAQYDTTLEAPVPPRSKRRPLSEIVTISGSVTQLGTRTTQEPRRCSLDSALNLTADLTKLMQDASSLQSYREDDEELTKNPPQQSALNSITKLTDGYADAGTLESAASTSSQYPESITAKGALHDNDSIELVALPLFSSLDERRRRTKRLDSTRSLPPRPTRETVIKGKPRPTDSRQCGLPRDDEEFERPESHTTRQGLWQGNSTNKRHGKTAGPDSDQKIEPRYDIQEEDEKLIQPQEEEEEEDPEEEYIDIGAATPLSSPIKAAPSTSKRSRRAISRAKSSRAKAPPLRPFSYSTLVSLLESMNGTIIGEEFSQLDLPSHEKLLMEKIIDSLSRLTLEMVFDENRYHVGIQRLEKALRVLEGFD